MIVEREPAEIFRSQCRRLQHRSQDRIQHEPSQLLHAGLRPAEQVETALERLLLRNVARHGIAVLIVLAGEKQCLELTVKPLTRHQTPLPERHGEDRSQRDGGTHHGGIQALSEATKRTRMVTSVSTPAARTRAISCQRAAGNTTTCPGTGRQVQWLGR